MRDIIPMAVEAGVDVLGGLQPPDVGDVVLRDVKARFGRQAALLGGLDPVYTFDLGDAEAVRSARPPGDRRRRSGRRVRPGHRGGDRAARPDELLRPRRRPGNMASTAATCRGLR